MKVRAHPIRLPICGSFAARRFLCALIAFVGLVIAACSELENPEPRTFFAETAPPPIQEFRWSNGGLPQSLDPARASAAPETDIVRAIFEGLTETSSQELNATPAIAESWDIAADSRIWTFRLRADAKWSNGKSVTAGDFVRSWQRLADLGESAAHRNLLDNIARVLQRKNPGDREPTEADDFLRAQANTPSDTGHGSSSPDTVNGNSALRIDEADATAEVPVPARQGDQLAVTALDDRTLQVELVRPDKDFAKLVANPIFRPIYSSGGQFDRKPHDDDIVTNGPFRIREFGANGIVLERSESYWKRNSVRLERVRFVPKNKAEDALEAYRAGDLDAITNTEFAPLVQKLLAPYNDVRRTTHAALNFYEINFAKPPFSDRRVREAMALSIERERLTEGELEGTMQPAFSFLPFASPNSKISQDKVRARELLEEAGFAEGENFPVIRLVVNRNDTQHRVARAVAQMWKKNLNIDTEIVIKQTAEMAAVRDRMEFDVIRRGVVLPTPDEIVSLMAIFGSQKFPTDREELGIDQSIESNTAAVTAPVIPHAEANSDASVAGQPDMAPVAFIVSEEDALYEFYAIPLYFPTSFTLVKPYVSGFEMNSLDAPSLLNVAIDNSWQPKRTS